MNGQWILDPRLGWDLVSNEPWAGCRITSNLAAFPDSGMGLGPGRARRAAPLASGARQLVRAGNQVGWVAMSPNDREGAAGEPGAWGQFRVLISPRNRNGSTRLSRGRIFKALRR